jgi:hypothetical protein
VREEAVGVRAVWGVRVDAPVIVGVLWFTLSSQLHLCTPRPECDITSTISSSSTSAADEARTRRRALAASPLPRGW